jgi:ABC-2 type transport system ATP-binding protein
MRQRLLFISALLHNPQVLLIDEPFVGLDPYGLIMLKDMIRQLSSEGISIFLATHSLNIAEELCARVGIISKGSIISTTKRKEFAEEGGIERLFIKLTS